jgi:hypothetical protein
VGHNGCEKPSAMSNTLDEKVRPHSDDDKSEHFQSGAAGAFALDEDPDAGLSEEERAAIVHLSFLIPMDNANCCIRTRNCYGS